MKNRIIYLDLERKLSGLLGKLPALVDAYAAKSREFSPNYLAWLKSVEEVLQQYKLPETGSFAAIRMEVLCIENGTAGAKDPRSRLQSRKAKLTEIARTLPHAQEVLEKALHPFQNRIHAAEDMIDQIILVALQAGIVQQFTNFPGDDSQKLQALSQALSQSEATNSGMLQVKMLVSYMDVLVLLDRSLARATAAAPL